MVSALYRCTGTSSGSDEHLAAATAMYREMGMTYWLVRRRQPSRVSDNSLSWESGLRPGGCASRGHRKTLERNKREHVCMPNPVRDLNQCFVGNGDGSRGGRPLEAVELQRRQ